MKTLYNSQIWKILELFYKNNNNPTHLREISRRIQLKESPLSRHLKVMLHDNVLIFKKEANLKKFFIAEHMIPIIFTSFDVIRFEELAPIRKTAVLLYINHLKEKPVYIILFGSTITHHRPDSDIDIIAVFNQKTRTKRTQDYVQAQTNMHIHEHQITYENFIKEIQLQENPVIQAGIDQGFPTYNQLSYYTELRKWMKGHVGTYLKTENS